MKVQTIVKVLMLVVFVIGMAACPGQRCDHDIDGNCTPQPQVTP